MNILNRTTHRSPALKQGILALLAATAFGLTSTSAHAGAAELNALQAVLNPVPIALATSQQLLTAYQQVIVQPKFASNNGKAITAGEALKAAGINAQDAGEVFATAIVAASGNSPLVGIFANRANFVPLAARTAGTGRGLNVLQIPSLSAVLFATDLSTNFNTAAVNAKNTSAAGAILGGNALKLVTLTPGTAATDSVDIVNAALQNKKLQSSAQNILRYVTAELVNVTNTADFAVRVGNGNGGDNKTNNTRFAVQIAVGAAAGDPTNAGNIAHAIFGQQQLRDDGTLTPIPTGPLVPSANLKNTAIRGLTVLVRNLGSFADIEEIQKIGNAVGKEISAGSIRLTTAAANVRTLAQAIINKPAVNSFGQAFVQNTASNKQDELVELAAYTIAGLSASADLNVSGARATAAANTLFQIITAVSGVRPSPTVGGPGLNGYSADLVGSVALTVLNSTINNDVKTAFRNLLLAPTTASRIDKTNVSAIQSIVAAVYNVPGLANPAAVARLENGFNLNGAVSDPETDFRPFNNPPNGQS
jgi:hypothetical protein